MCTRCLVTIPSRRLRAGNTAEFKVFGDGNGAKPTSTADQQSTAYAFSKRALRHHTMAEIDAGARLDRDWLSRGMSDLGSLRPHARRSRELKGKEITWALPG